MPSATPFASTTQAGIGQRAEDADDEADRERDRNGRRRVGRWAVRSSMRISEVDERDSSWEDHSPIFRVYLFRKGASADSWTTWTYELADTDVLEVLQWAQEHVGDAGLYAVALVSRRASAPDEPARRGLTWLLGADANGTPLSPRETTLHERMQQLRGKLLNLG